jgi:hypothetical protein
MMEPRARSAVQNLNTFHAITDFPDFCIIWLQFNLKIRLYRSNNGDGMWLGFIVFQNPDEDLIFGFQEC